MNYFNLINTTLIYIIKSFKEYGTVNHISSENIDVDMPLIKALSVMQSGTANQFQVIEDCMVIGVIYFRNFLGSPLINKWSFAI